MFAIPTGLLVAVAIAVFVIVLVAKGVIIVSQSESIVIERLGRFHAVLPPGINIIWPILDQPRVVEWKYPTETPDGRRLYLRRRITRIDLREVVFDFPQQSVITKDNVITQINAMLYFQVMDPKSVVYEIANLPDAIEKLCQTSLRNVIGEMELDEILASRDKINKALQMILDEASEKWGVKVNRVELQDVSLPQDIRMAMEKQMRAERDRRAAILEAEGDKGSRVLRSEGEREAAINKADGQREATIREANGLAEARLVTAQAEGKAIGLISQALTQTGCDPAQYLIALKYLETLREIASSGGPKVVYLPIEATGALGAIGGIKELFKDGAHHKTITPAMPGDKPTPRAPAPTAETSPPPPLSAQASTPEQPAEPHYGPGTGPLPPIEGFGQG